MATQQPLAGAGGAPGPQFIIQPDTDDDDATAAGGTGTTTAAGTAGTTLPPAVSVAVQMGALVRLFALLISRRTGILVMLLASPSLMALMALGFSSLPDKVFLPPTGYGYNNGVWCGESAASLTGDTEAYHGIPVLFFVPLGFVFQLVATVIVLSTETRNKNIRAVVNLSTPISAVYLSWFAVLAAYASLGAVLGVATGYATQLHTFKFASAAAIIGAMVVASIAHVAMGMLLGSFVTRPLYVHSLNMLAVIAALVMLLVVPEVFNNNAFANYNLGFISLYGRGGQVGTYTDARHAYNGTCYTWPSGIQALYAPSPDPAGAASCAVSAVSANGCSSLAADASKPPGAGTIHMGFEWYPVTNIQRLFVDVISTQVLGGNSTEECKIAVTNTTTGGNPTDDDEGDYKHCMYTYANYQATRTYPFFPQGHVCAKVGGGTDPNPLCKTLLGQDVPVLAVGFYEAPGARAATLMNLMLVPLYLLAALLVAFLFPNDTGVRRVRFFGEPAGIPSAAATTGRHSQRVCVENITKRYGAKTAVDGVTATMREGEVFALLGHNGAGKSTLFQMLAGNLRMSAGAASVYGLDTATEMDSDDVLWDQLTGREHVRAYLALRGQSSSADAIDDVLAELDLCEVGDNPVGSFSGGMKRRLSVALASIGDDVKVLFFDEPTTGLDPINGRLVWKLLQNRKKNRIVILTTHSMEEAELLADRIGVMNNGVLRAYGTPIFLKTSLSGATDRFRTRITLNEGASNATITSQFLGLAPDSRVVSTSATSAASGENSAENVMVMGVGQKGLENVENLFAWLNSSPLVERWRVFNMTLEDVFAVVGGRDHDATTGSGPSCSCCMRCCRCYVGRESDSLVESAPIDLQAASKAVVELITTESPASMTAQTVAVVAKSVLQLMRGSWKSLLVIFSVCTLPVLLITHLAGSKNTNADGAAQAVLLAIGFGLAPSLILPWLVVTVVEDNSGGLLELMVLQGLRIRSHVLGTFAYVFTVVLLANLAVLALCVVTAAPMVINQSGTGVVLLLLALIVSSVWTAAVAAMLSSMFKRVGMAAGVTGFLTLLGVAAAFGITIIKINDDDDQQNDDNDNIELNNDDFFSPKTKFPVELNLAPYFGYFNALITLGNTTVHTRATARAAGVALALTLAQAAAYLAVGVYIYARRVANRVMLPSSKTFLSGSAAAPLLGGTGGSSISGTGGDSGGNGAAIGVFDKTRKVYGGGSKLKVALERLDLGFKRGEFLGVLGPNGAGKSTAFNIMAGLTSATSGDAYINGHSVTGDCETARRYLGSCPQFPRLWNDLTVSDHLGLYVAIRGLPSPWSLRRQQRREAGRIVEVLATVMQLGGGTLHKPVRALSGGMKRRLSLAITLVGCPPLTVLDEPTTGLDPITRRDVWNLLAQLQRKDDNACVISTHSMEEADTLCNRITIITRGQLRVSGTQDELKKRYGTGFTLQLTAGAAGFDVGRFLTACVHPQAAVKTRTGRVFNCHVPAGVDLAVLFRACCEADAAGSLQDWLVSETTLEDVFIRVVQQHEPAP